MITEDVSAFIFLSVFTALQSQKAVTSFFVSKQLLPSGFALKGPIHVQVTISRRLRIGRDGNLYQSEAYDMP